MHEAEKVQIDSINHNDLNAPVVTLKKSLRYEHYAGVTDYGEAGLL